MKNIISNDLFIYICHNCIPESKRLPRQWTEGKLHVQLKVLPCTGKLDTQYMFHAFEGGGHGVCVFGCPTGECRLAQGNYRADIRSNTVKKLLAEIGLEPERMQFVYYSKKESFEGLKKLLNEKVVEFCKLDENPIYQKRLKATD